MRGRVGADEAILYGIASAISNDVADYYATRVEAERVLEQVVRDAPELRGQLWVEPVELPASPN